MRAIITGGAGFIGSHITDAVPGAVVVDTLVKGRAARLEGSRLEQVDIRDAGALAAVFADVRPTHVFHLAAQADVRVSVADPTLDASVNVLGTINVLEAARTHGAKIIFASTGGALYGESDALPSSEDAPKAPEAPYGTAKYCAEEYLRLWNRLYGTEHVVLRLGNVYGPRQDPAGEAGVVSIFAGKAHRGERPTIFGDGSQTRDYVYVGDVVRAFTTAAGHEGGGEWNVGTGRETSVLRLIELMGAAAGPGIDPIFADARPGELQRSCLDVSAAERDLGFTAGTSIEDGLAAVYAWVAEGEPERGAL
jgi:UDP-glucose 4-epimerase